MEATALPRVYQIVSYLPFSLEQNATEKKETTRLQIERMGRITNMEEAGKEMHNKLTRMEESQAKKMQSKLTLTEEAQAKKLKDFEKNDRPGVYAEPLLPPTS